MSRSRSWGLTAAFGAAAVWQFVSWGGRISLLTEAEMFDWWSWTRIGGSLLFGVLLLLAAIGGRRTGYAKGVALGFLIFALATWGRSLSNVWADEANTLAFNLVHTGLAGVTWILGAWTVVASRSSGR